MIQLRDYQTEAVDALIRYWQANGGNPLVDMATGTGKSLVIGELTRRIMAAQHGSAAARRVLILTHVRELIEQDAAALTKAWPGAPYGIYCAGLGAREAHAPVLLASIQSIYRNPEAVGRRNLVIIDEAHLCPRSGQGMYLRTLNALRTLHPHMRVAGFTATPFRLDSGRLDEGDAKQRLFDEVVFTYGIGQAIADGRLSPLVSAPTRTAIDTSAVHRSKGEFVQSELEAAASTAPVMRGAIDELLRWGKDRKSWLIFCASVRHAEAMRDALQAQGIMTATVTGETPTDERRRIFDAFKGGHIRALTGANVFTTGFDAPNIDLIAMLRPTLSTGLYIQMLGRGTRLADGKADCLVLDFARNIKRHGPVDAVTPLTMGGASETVDRSKRHKPDPDRQMELPDLDHSASDAPVMSAAMAWLPVESFSVRDYRSARNPDKPPSLLVTYHIGADVHREWLALELPGRARGFATAKWRQLGGRYPAPWKVAEAINRQGELGPALEISLRKREVRTGSGLSAWEVAGRRVREISAKAS